jgi:hypothetical protein
MSRLISKIDLVIIFHIQKFLELILKK